jgi:S-adenosylmethionine-diacylglycerol 3-amino-3-carboxypropyl transferase
LLAGGTRAQRQQFYRRNWDTRLWRAAFALFFSCPVMSRLGRDPSQFAYAEGSLAQHLRHRVRHALVAFDPAANPYVQWILTGEHRTALPFALRPENFDPIRTNLDRLEWRCQSLEAFLETYAGEPVARWNLSDIFEYLSPGHSRRLLQAIAGVSRRGARIVYWNLLARRERPPELAATWRPLRKLARRLHHADKAFFYSRVVVEERQ